jgi:2-dehydropantoate 2-reductase
MADPRPEPEVRRILVYGAGVLGSLYAARLHEAGHDVALLARGQRLADLRAHGVVIEDALTGERTTTPVRLVEQLAPEDAYDLVLVVMRQHQVAGVLPALAANRYTPNVLFMGNNASGPEKLVAALGRGRVVLGFGSAGGRREGPVVRCLWKMGKRRARVTIGELDGAASPRLQRIAAAFQGAGFPVVVSPHMDAWLKSHAALVLPLAGALYAAGGDNYRLARTRDAVVLAVRAIREGFAALRKLGLPLTPRALWPYARLPEPLLVPLAQRYLGTKVAEIALAGHANAARDEMKAFADEFRALCGTAATPMVAWDRLYAYIDPAVPTIPEGRATVPLRWI